MRHGEGPVDRSRPGSRGGEGPFRPEGFGNAVQLFGQRRGKKKNPALICSEIKTGMNQNRGPARRMPRPSGAYAVFLLEHGKPRRFRPRLRERRADLSLRPCVHRRGALRTDGLENILCHYYSGSARPCQAPDRRGVFRVSPLDAGAPLLYCRERKDPPQTLS